MTRQAPHAGKFRVAFAVLLTVAILAILVVVLVASKGNQRGRGTPGWSTFVPAATGAGGESEIAAYVGAKYRLSTTSQLDVATPIAVTDTSSSGVTTGSGLTVVVNTSTSGSSSDAKLSLLNGPAVGYDICGSGSDCRLPGTPSQARLLLVRREALELALYTLEYNSADQYVVVVLPPARTTTTNGKHEVSITIAVLFSRAELQQLLTTPINHTLTSTPPAIAQLGTWLRTGEAALVDNLTGRGLFEEAVEQDQQGSHLLVLSQLATQ